jgi:hypothetical protein
MRMERKAAAALAALAFSITGVFSGVLVFDASASEQGIVTAGYYHNRPQP